MNYIAFDLEFNQDYQSLRVTEEQAYLCPYEIIQIGAIKSDYQFNTVATFNRFVKPCIYREINTFVTDLTGINTNQLISEQPFPMVYQDFIEFIGDSDAVFCIWGMSDLKELYRNASYYKLDIRSLPQIFINLQPYVSTHLKLGNHRLLKLQAAVELLDIATPYKFHNALYDAFYTNEILKKIYTQRIQPMLYNPNIVSIRPRQPKKIVDYEKLIQQFKKMYERELSDEEQDMIKLAYKMGRTNQFVSEK